MNVVKGLLRGAMALAIAASAVAPASATTLVRESLDDLVRGNRAIVVGEVVDASSYWNEDHTFILTDVRVAVHEALKGDVSDREITVTLMGGRVDDITTLIVGGPELIPGNSYVLFLNEENLPGAERALTVRDLVQGAFDVKIGRDGLRAVSQANSHPLLPDRSGYIDAPGGTEGMPLPAMMNSIRETVERQRTRQEVQ
ncbi:MAG TPA: hypothetical protein VH394_10005 [Thermoanaerobaculia bacterium]|jgi:hypothetical protein|nr:hypothetical protein [Thermoanaerobaculia bacterium]